MSSNRKFATPSVVVVVALVAVLAVLSLGFSDSGSSQASSSRVCFPASHWGPVAKRYRPCVEVVQVQEDGSFSYRVSDADGTTRYTAGVGALDR